MTPLINKPGRRRGIAPNRDLTVMMIILWTHALALVLVVVSHARIDSVDAATELQNHNQPMQMPVYVSRGEPEPDLFCEAPAISDNQGMSEAWSAEIGHVVGTGSVMPASMTNAEPETVWTANVTVGTASDSQSLGWEEGVTTPVALKELPELGPGPGQICNTVAPE